MNKLQIIKKKFRSFEKIQLYIGTQVGHNGTKVKTFHHLLEILFRDLVSKIIKCLFRFLRTAAEVIIKNGKKALEPSTTQVHFRKKKHLPPTYI